MFQLVENASADGDVDYYRFFQECKKCKNLGRKQIPTRSRCFRCMKVCKDALSYVSSSSVTSLMFQLVIMVIISLVSSSLLFTLHCQQQGLREEMTIGQWHHHTSPGAGSAYKSPPPYNRNPSAVALITFAGYLCPLQNTFQTVRHYFGSIDTVSRCWNNGSLCFRSMMIYRSYFYLGWRRLAAMSRVCEV